jgi:hypothetical protein
MAQTFDTSRVGGGTYELEQDASGNYKLKSVGFAQVNKLNLPDLKTSDTTTPPKTTIQPVKTPEVADPFKKLSAQNTGGGEGGQGGGQDYSGVMLKTPQVKDAEVRNAGDAMTKEQLTESFAGEEKPTQTYSEQLANIQRGQMTDNNIGFGEQKLDTEKFKGSTTGTLSDPLEKQDVKPERTTGLQKVTSKAKALGTDAISKTKKVIGTVAKMLIPGANVLSMITPEETATQKLNKSHFNVRDDGRIAGNPATDLYAGFNRTSDFGNLEKAGAKRLSTRQKTIERKGYKAGDKFFDDTEKMKEQQKDYTAKKQAAKTKKDLSTGGVAPGASGGNGGSGSDSGRVICTDLHRTGELSTKDWIRDTKFTFKTLSIKHVKGYLLWAEPTVKHMQKYPRYRKIWKHIAQHRANDIAWRLNEGKFDLLGRIYAGIGEPVCWALGNFVSDKQISKYNLTHWRRA